MDLTALLKLGVVTGVVLNILDFVVQGNLLAGMYAANPVFRNTDDMNAKPQHGYLEPC